MGSGGRLTASEEATVRAALAGGLPGVASRSECIERTGRLLASVNHPKEVAPQMRTSGTMSPLPPSVA